MRSHARSLPAVPLNVDREVKTLFAAVAKELQRLGLIRR
jgi:hypothetical protein